jgi:galactose-1-phosphate uridylyltransferase
MDAVRQALIPWSRQRGPLIWACVFTPLASAHRMALFQVMRAIHFFTQVDEESLKAIAKITEADYFKAGSAEDLKQVYKHLSTQFTMEKRETENYSLAFGLGTGVSFSRTLAVCTLVQIRSAEFF